MKAYLLALSLLALLTASACGGGTEPGNPPAQAPTITSQPQDQSTPLAQTASFTVTATGTTPLTYQWSKNGSAITGATSSSYATPPVAVGDSGAVFTVKVTNSAGSATSRSALLTVGPRSPLAGDLRFQLVDSVFTVNGYGNAGREFTPTYWVGWDCRSAITMAVQCH